MIAGRLELRLLLFIVGHGKVVLLIVGWPQTVHVSSTQWLAVPWAQLVYFKREPKKITPKNLFVSASSESCSSDGEEGQTALSQPPTNLNEPLFEQQPTTRVRRLLKDLRPWLPCLLQCTAQQPRLS